MPTREVRISVTLDGLQNAVDQSNAMAGGIRDVGTAATEATSKAAPLGDAVDKIATSATAAAPAVAAVGTSIAGLSDALKGQIGPSADAAFAAIDRLGNVTGIRGLGLGIVQATVQMEAFRKSTQDAEAAGTKMPPAVGAALATMQSQIDGATARLGGLKAGMSEVQTRSLAMGESWRQAASSGGSLNSMLFNLAEGSTGTAAALAKTGLGVIGVGAAFKAGLVLGEEFDKGLKKVGIDLAGLGEPINFASKGIVGLAGAAAGLVGSADLTKWANDARKAMSEYGDLLDPISLKVNTLMKVHQAAGLQLTADEAALKKVGVAWQDVGAVATTTATQIKLVDDALAQSAVQGKSQLDTIQLNSKALIELKQRLEDEGISLSTLSPRMQTAILLSQGLADAHTKHAAALKLIQESTGAVIPAMDKLLNTLQQEDQAALKSKTSITDVANAHEKAVLALVEYGKQNGLSAEQVAKLIVEQAKMLDVTKAATTEDIDRMNIALQKYGVNLEDVGKKTETLVEQQKRLNDELKTSMAQWAADTETIKTRNAAIDAGTASTNAWGAAVNGTTSGLIENTTQAAAWGASMSNISKTTAQATIEMANLPKDLHDAATAALAASDAFGNLASKFGDVSAAADNATAGLVGVAWEMRSATKETFTLNDSQNALVESLAKVSDQYGKTSLWVEHLLSQFEKGTVSLADFRQELANMLTGMKQLPDMFGDTSVQMNIMLTLLDKFKNTAGNGWPDTTTTVPYSNPSNPVTGR